MSSPKVIARVVMWCMYTVFFVVNVLRFLIIVVPYYLNILRVEK
jgi:hypothetical protein